MSGDVRRIGLIGGECTGKTTLAAALADALPACVVGEHLRSFVDLNGRAPRAEEQQLIMLEQQAAEDRAGGSCPLGVLVADPAPLMTAVYSLAYFDDPSLVARGVELASAYDLLVWCDIDLPWVPDGVQRDGPELRAREHGLIADVVRRSLEPAGVPVLLVSGPTASRLDGVLRAWQPGGPNTPT